MTIAICFAIGFLLVTRWWGDGEGEGKWVGLFSTCGLLAVGWVLALAANSSEDGQSVDYSEAWQWMIGGNLSAAAAVLGGTVLLSTLIWSHKRDRSPAHYQHIQDSRRHNMKEKRYGCIRRAGAIAAMAALTAAVWWATIKGLRLLFKGEG